MTQRQPDSWKANQQRVLRALREGRDWTQDEAARACGLPYWTWVHLEAGRREIRASEAATIARTYHLDPGELHRRLDPEAAPFARRAAMLAAGMPPERVDAIETDCADWPTDEGDDYVRVHIRAHLTRSRDPISNGVPRRQTG